MTKPKQDLKCGICNGKAKGYATSITLKVRNKKLSMDMAPYYTKLPKPICKPCLKTLKRSIASELFPGKTIRIKFDLDKEPVTQRG